MSSMTSGREGTRRKERVFHAQRTTFPKALKCLLPPRTDPMNSQLLTVGIDATAYTGVCFYSQFDFYSQLSVITKP